MPFETLNDYSLAVADYLCDEYGEISKNLRMTQSQSTVVCGLVDYCYENDDSINNTAHYLLEFIRATQKNDSI